MVCAYEQSELLMNDNCFVYYSPHIHVPKHITAPNGLCFSIFHNHPVLEGIFWRDKDRLVEGRTLIKSQFLSECLLYDPSCTK